ncbi:unnamed protein product [Rotaria sp. Silwood1]|nr:unnamed protein product [Rotaria sp. Silwood1]
MLIQYLVIFTVFATNFVNGYETDFNNSTANTTNKTSKYESDRSNNVVVVQNFCFSGDSHVQLIDGTSKKIGELQSGDLVYAYDGFKLVSAEMIMMLDRQASTKTIFHTLKTESDHQLSLTSYHLIAIVSSNGKPTYKPAKDLQIHDRLFILSNNQLVSSPIVEIIIDIKTGYYAPFTSQGVLFVNGILSSCYANVKSHDAAHFYMSSLKWLYYISRFLMINDPFGTSSKDGIHWIPRLMFEFGQRFRPSTLLL